MRKAAEAPLVVDDDARRADGAAAQIVDADARRDRERARLELRGLRARFVRDVVEVVAFALAAVWAIYTFWYQQHWLPRQVPPMVVVSVDLTATGERDGLLALTAHVKLRNPGTSRVRMLAQNLVLVGAHVRATGDRPLAERVPDGAAAWSVARGTDVAASEALASAAQSFLPPTTATLEPGEELAHDYVFYVAPGTYDLVRLQTSVLYTRTGTRVRGVDRQARRQRRARAARLHRGVPSARLHRHRHRRRERSVAVAGGEEVARRPRSRSAPAAARSRRRGRSRARAS